MSSRISWDELNSHLNTSKNNPIVKITKQIKQYPKISAVVCDDSFALENADNNRNEGLLPARIVAYSSGMNELLSNPFIKMDFNYYDDLKGKTGATEDSSFDMNRLFYLNYDSNKFMSVCNFLFDADDYDMESFEVGQKATDFGGIGLGAIKRELLIKDIHSFVVNLKLKKGIQESEFLHSALNIALDDLKKCATFVNETKRETKTESYHDVELIYWVNKSTKSAFRYYFKTAFNLFRVFYFFQLLNTQLISLDTRKAVAAAKAGSYENLSDELPKHEAANQIFRISGITFRKENESRLHYRKLSDGEHQLLQVLGSLLLMDATGTLFLFDEPETHFNPDWRSKFVSMANESIDKERDQEIILTTHSPYIVSDCKKENVYIFQRNPDGTVSQPKPPEINTFGTSIDIITYAVFGKNDTISELSKSRIEEIRGMPLDSPQNIQAAKEASRILGESVEKVLLFKEFISKESELNK